MHAHIHGPNFKNLGDELMVRSIISALGNEYDFSLWHAPGVGANPSKQLRHRLGLKDKFPHMFGGWLPDRLRNRCQAFRTRNIDVIFDCSGYRYSNHRGWILTNGCALSALRWQWSGKPFIFLPQAFGPFRGRITRALMKRIFKNSIFIFTRDSTSYDHVIDLVGEADNIRQCPDITHDYDGIMPDHPEIYNESVCISPNRRMVEATSFKISSSYMKFMKHCIKRVCDKGFKPFLVVHEPGDLPLAKELSDSGTGDISIHQLSAPTIKGAIRFCRAVFSSRFHILVNALSQGVPCMATSWAHKYERLFEEYDCVDLLVSPASSIKEIDKIIERILLNPTHSQLRARIRNYADKHREKVREMWCEVNDTITTRSGQKPK